MIWARLNRFFSIEQRGSTIQTEILAGCSTFLALSYIFIVNPAILAQAGIDKSSALFATIAASGLATLAMGIWARLPFAVAPGMEMNAYVAFFVVGTLGLNWNQALGTVLWSGLLCLAVTLTGAREGIINAIPARMKSGLSLSVGVFLVLVALRVAGILQYEGVSLRGFGPLTGVGAQALVGGTVLIFILERLRVRGSVLISMLLMAPVCLFSAHGTSPDGPPQVSSSMLAAVGRLDAAVVMQPSALNVILTLFVLDFYGSIAKFVGLTLRTDLMEEGKLPRMKEALLVDGLATSAGACLGTSSLITYVESAVGIATGGRTGLTAVVCGLLMLSCFFTVPLFQMVPTVATTGALLFVAVKLCPPLAELRRYGQVDRLALIVMVATVILTFAIDKAMLAGFLIYLAGDLGRRQRPNTYLAISAALLGLGSLLQQTFQR